MRLVFVWTDFSTIGGISNRIRSTLAAAQGRAVEYVGLSLRNTEQKSTPSVLCYEQQPAEVLAAIETWTEKDTVVILANTVNRLFPRQISEKLQTLPIIYMCSGQLAFFIQNSSVLLDQDFVENLKASRIMAFSDADINFQRQLGIHGQIKGYMPVKIRPRNTYSLKHNRHLGFVGRIDYKTKDCLALIDVAMAAKRAGLPHLKVFTTTGANSPDYAHFVATVRQHHVSDHIEIIENETDHDNIYRTISVLLLPSRQESFGNVVLESFSYGIPVISTSYAPGPAETIVPGQSGFLLDQFSGDAVVELVKNMTQTDRKTLSDKAYRQHKKYSMASYLDFMEKTARDVLETFSGQNELSVMPKLLISERTLSASTPTKPLQIMRFPAKQSPLKKPSENFKPVGLAKTEMLLGRALYRSLAKPSRFLKLPFKISKIIKAQRTDFSIAAMEVLRQRGLEPALEYIRSLGKLPFAADIEPMLRAQAAASDQDWLIGLNAWLALRGSPQVALADGPGSRFMKLKPGKAITFVDGPLVSIIMPAFNSEKTIRHAAGSILAQSWRNLELIIVDDASSDKTSIIAHELAASDARVKVLVNPKNVGPYVSKNRALTFASGDFITGQDADDWALPYRIERQAGALLGNANLDAVIGYMLRMSIDGKVLQPTRIGRMSFDGVNRLASISLFMRAGVLRDKLGFWDSVKFGADSEFIARADLLLGKRFRNECQVTMFCLDHEDSLTNHTEFGINRVTGVEGIRQDYRKSWVAWQKNLKAGDVYLPFPQTERRFPAPAEMLVPQSDISESD